MKDLTALRWKLEGMTVGELRTRLENLKDDCNSSLPLHLLIDARIEYGEVEKELLCREANPFLNGTQNPFEY
jgi:hypothetical protein